MVVFDGVCNLCNRSVRFILRHEAEPRFQFAPLQSSAGARLLGERNFFVDDLRRLFWSPMKGPMSGRMRRFELPDTSKAAGSCLDSYESCRDHSGTGYTMWLLETGIVGLVELIRAWCLRPSFGLDSWASSQCTLTTRSSRPIGLTRGAPRARLKSMRRRRAPSASSRRLNAGVRLHDGRNPISIGESGRRIWYCRTSCRELAARVSRKFS